MKNLTEAIDKINMEMDKYLFRILSEQEERNFNRLLDARDLLQNIIYSQIDFNEYIDKVYTDREEAFKAVYFLKRYVGLNASLKIHSTTKGYISLVTIITYTIEIN